jgi:hypothetical protein
VDRLALSVALSVVVLVTACTNPRKDAVSEMFGQIPVQLGPVMSLEQAAQELTGEEEWPAAFALSEPGDEVQYFCACSTGGILMGTEGYALFRRERLIRSFGEIHY